MVGKAGRWILVLFFFVAFAGPGAFTQQPPAPSFKDTTVLPEGPIGARIKSLIETMNSGSAERFKRFLSEECEKRFRDMVPLEEHVATAFRFHRDTGGVDFYSVRTYTPERPGFLWRTGPFTRLRLRRWPSLSRGASGSCGQSPTRDS